jgi:hypothetical protein
MHEDNLSRTTDVNALNFQTIASDTDTLGEVIDTRGYDSLRIVNKSGTVTTGNVTISAIYEDDVVGMGTKTLIPTTNLYGNTLAGTIIDAANTIARIGVVPHKRFVQVTYTTANTANLQIGSNAVMGNADIATY